MEEPLPSMPFFVLVVCSGSMNPVLGRPEGQGAQLLVFRVDVSFWSLLQNLLV